jgi:hypothetical protein
MLSNGDKELMGEADAVLLSEDAGKKLVDFATPYTIPLFFFRGDFTKPWKQGTGTLLNLDGRGYVLTAGHVVEDYCAADACAVTIKKTRHTYRARFSRHASRFIDRTSIDVGVLEIVADQFEDYRSYDRMYIVDPKLVQICTPDELISANDWMASTGYPLETALIEPGGAGMRLVVYTTTIAGLHPAPPSPLPKSEPAAQSIDLWVPREGQLQTFPHHISNIDMPLFGGVSGGGCWKTGVRAIPRIYDPENPRLHLVAIHIGSTLPMPTLQNARFGREVMVGHHLRLLADAFPDMRASVYQRWPELVDEIWRVPPI